MVVKKEGECSKEQISNNIAKLIKEGKPRDQAVAIAFSGCPQQKADGQLFTQEEVEYSQAVHPYSNAQVEGITVSPTCGICSFFNRNEGQPTSCVIVENQPLEIVSEGQCTRWVGISYVKNEQKSIYIGGAIKALDDKGRIGGYLVRYGDPNTKDLDGEYFTKDTELELDWYKQRPILFHHGGDAGVKGVAIGIMDTLREDDEGVWAEGILNLRQKYVRAIHRMVKEGILDWSCGTLPQLVEVAKDGFIKRWPIIEGSTTPTPAMPFNATRIHTIKGLIEASKGTIPELFEDASANGDSVFQTLFDSELSMKGIDMNPEQIAELQAIVEPMVREILDSMTGEKQGIEEEEEIEIAKQAMEDEAEVILEDEMKGEHNPGEDEEYESSMKKSVEKIIFENVSNIALAGMKAVSDHRNGHQKSISDAIEIAAEKLNKGAVTYGRAKSNVGGAEQSRKGAYGTGDNPAQAPGQMGRAQKPSLASFIKSAANHDFGSSGGKAQNPYIGDHGGYLLGQELRNEILPPLRENVVAFDAGVRQTNVATGIGVITLPKMTTAPTAFRPGINQAITESDTSFDTVTAFLRPIAALVTIPFQLLEQSPLAVEQRIREEMIRSIALQIDIEILNGTGTVVSGTGAQIRGVKTVLEGDGSLSSSNIVTLATNGRKPTFDDANNAETQIAEGNVPDTEPKSWIMHSRSRGRYRSLTATTGEPLFRDNYGIEAFPELIGYPVHVGNQIPITDTIGSTSDNSEIYFGAWRFLEYVMQDALEIIVDRVTLANQLQARIIAYTYSDILIHYPEAFYVMKGVR